MKNLKDYLNKHMNSVLPRPKRDPVIFNIDADLYSQEQLDSIIDGTMTLGEFKTITDKANSVEQNVFDKVSKMKQLPHKSWVKFFFNNNIMVEIKVTDKKLTSEVKNEIDKLINAIDLIIKGK